MCVARQLKLSEPVNVELRGGVDGVDGGEDDEYGQCHLRYEIISDYFK